MTAATADELALIRRHKGAFRASQYAAFWDVEQHRLSDYTDHDDPYGGAR